MCLICQWPLSSSPPWWEIHNHGAVPIVFTESSTESINLTQEALRASGFNSNRHTYTYMCAHKRTCMHANMNTLQVNTQDIVPAFFSSYIQMKELQLDPTVPFDSNLSRMLNLSVVCIFILMWPAAVVVAHDATQRERMSNPLSHRTK